MRLGKKRTIRITLVLTLAVLGFFAVQRIRTIQSSDDGKIWEMASAAIAAEQWDEAEIHLRRVLQLNPAHHDARMTLIDLYKRQAADDKADPRVIDHMFQAVEHRPDDLQLAERLVEMLADAGDARANEVAHRIIEQGSTHSKSLHLAAVDALQKKDFDTVEKYLQTIYSSGATRNLGAVLVELDLCRQTKQTERLNKSIEDNLSAISKLDRWAIDSLVESDKEAILRFLLVALNTAPDSRVLLQRLNRGLLIIEHQVTVAETIEEKVEACEQAASLLAFSESRFPISSLKDLDELKRRQAVLTSFDRFATRAAESEAATPLLLFWYARAAEHLHGDDVVLARLSRGLEMGDLSDEKKRGEMLLLHMLAADRLLRRGMLTEAEQHVAELRDRKETEGFAEVLAGQLALSDRRPADAYQHIEKAEQILGSSLPLRVARLKALVLAENWELSLPVAEDLYAAWATMSELETHWVQQHLGNRDRLTLLLGTNYLLVGDEDKAEPLLQSLQGTELEPTSVEIRADHYLRHSRIIEARDLLRSASKQFPSRYRIAMLLAFAHEAEGHPDSARRILEGFAQKHPDHLAAQIEVAKWRRRHDDLEGALSWMQTTAARFKDQPIPQLLVTQLLIETNRPAEAQEAIELIAKNPKLNNYAQLLTAQLALRLNGYAEASRLLVDADQAVKRSGIASLLRAEAERQSNQITEAARSYVSTLRYNHLQSEAQIGLHKAIVQLIKREGLDEADQLIEKLAVENPDEKLIWLIGSHIATARQDATTALTRLAKYQQLDPKSFFAAYEQGRIHYLKREPQQAIEHVQRALELQPKNAVAHRLATNILSLMGKHDQAIEHVNQVEQLTQQDDGTTMIIAGQLWRAGQQQKAIDALVSWLRRDEAQAGPFLLLAGFYADQERFSDAEALLAEALRRKQLDDKNAIRFETIQLHLRQQQWNEAHAAAIQLIKADKTRPNSVRIADIFFKAGWHDAALQFVELARNASDEDDEWSLDFMEAMITMKQGQQGQDEAKLLSAREQLEKLLERQPNNVIVLNNLAWLCAADLKDSAKALEYAEQLRDMVEIEKLPPTIVDTIVEAYISANRHSQALGLVDSSLSVHPSSATLHLLAGKLVLKSDRLTHELLDRAQSDLQQAMELGIDEARRAEVEQLLAEVNRRRSQLKPAAAISPTPAVSSSPSSGFETRDATSDSLRPFTGATGTGTAVEDADLK